MEVEVSGITYSICWKKENHRHEYMGQTDTCQSGGGGGLMDKGEAISQRTYIYKP